jgi:transcriptional regulator with PAS, ATPase and Fis domain/TorA maturation chaperone TorD
LDDHARLSRIDAELELLAWLILAFRPITQESAATLLGVDPRSLLAQAKIDHRPIANNLLQTPSSMSDELESEYVRLFVNAPGGAPAPLEALAYLGDEGQNARLEFLRDLSREIDRLGLSAAPARNSFPVDHLTKIIELLYHCHKEPDDTGSAPRIARSFLAGWVPTFVERLEAATPPLFYRNAGRVLEAVLESSMTDSGKKNPQNSADERPIPGPPSVHTRVLHSLTDGILLVDLDRRILYANNVLAGYYGVHSDELVGKSCEDVIGFDHCRTCPHRDIVTGEDTFTGHNLTCDRINMGPFCVSASPYFDEAGNITGMVEVYRDMRSLGAYIEDIEQKNVELEVERKRLDDILTGSSDGYYVATLDRKIVRADGKLLNLLGLTEREVLGKGCNEIFGSDKCQTDCPILWTAKNGKNVIACREHIHAADGPLPIDKSIFLKKAHDDSPPEVIGVVRNASEIVELRRFARRGHRYKKLVSRTREMEEVFDLISLFGPTENSVLILGESGTGKELVADAIQEVSPRRKSPFIKINCSALNDELLASELFGHLRGAFTGADKDKLGKFEVADGGTMFLDEVGEMSPSLQTKLLRVLEQQEFEPVGSTETKKVNVRVIAATNLDLDQAIRDGDFRKDLYYRLNAIQIKLPPLRRRRGDIPLLVEQFITTLNETYDRGVVAISARALDMLTHYPWPGNVRELRNAINFAYVCANGKRIERQDFPEHIRVPETLEVLKTETAVVRGGSKEEDRIREVLDRFDGNRTLAAQALGVSRTTLWRRLKALGLH